MELESRCEALTAWPGGAGIAGYGLGWRTVDEVQILSFAVDPARRRRGVGSRLLGAYLERLRQGRARRVSLEVGVSNAAAPGLYSRLALVEQGRRPRSYPGGETALLYGAEL